MDTAQFEGRKREHIRHALDPAHQARGLSGLDRIHLHHDALPDLDLKDVRLDSLCLGRPAPTPFFVPGMTAGHEQAPKINRVLARVCAERGWAMGVGSQRRELESGGDAWLETVDRWKDLRRDAPGLVLIANIGISQLGTASMDPLRRLVEGLGAEALAVHLNPLQEALQPEGTPAFRGALEALRALCEGIGLPVVLKETGCGFSPVTLRKLRGIRLAAIDVSGLGGTHWGRIEGARAAAGSAPDPVRAEAARTFADWGESTVDSVLAVRETLPHSEIWASGGVRTGLDAAKLVALGAHRVGFAQPALEAALEGEDALRRWMETREFELKTALFCTGSESPLALRQRESSQKERAWKPSAI